MIHRPAFKVSNDWNIFHIEQFHEQIFSTLSPWTENDPWKDSWTDRFMNIFRTVIWKVKIYIQGHIANLQNQILQYKLWNVSHFNSSSFPIRYNRNWNHTNLCTINRSAHVGKFDRSKMAFFAIRLFRPLNNNPNGINIQIFGVQAYS